MGDDLLGEQSYFNKPRDARSHLGLKKEDLISISYFFPPGTMSVAVDRYRNPSRVIFFHIQCQGRENQIPGSLERFEYVNRLLFILKEICFFLCFLHLGPFFALKTVSLSFPLNRNCLLRFRCEPFVPRSLLQSRGEKISLLKFKT